MTFSRTRLTHCATLLLALSSGGVSGAQSLLQLSVSGTRAEASVSLPDAPSYSSSLQQPAQAPAAQTPSPVPQNETDDQRKAREKREQQEESDREVKQELTQRAGGVIPIFTVVMNGQQTVPLTPKQKFTISLHTIIDPYTIGLAAVIGGGYGELTDDHTGYGHGPAGYFKRVGASYADNVDGNLIGNALLPVILKQDPRYFRMGHGKIVHRMFYSAMTTFICHGDNGKLQFNYSNVLGNFISGGISNAYYPSDERGFGLTITNASVVTLEGMLGAQLLEFSPDINDLLKRRHQRKLAQKAAAAAAKNPASDQPVVVQPAAPAPLPSPQP